MPWKVKLAFYGICTALVGLLVAWTIDAAITHVPEYVPDGLIRLVTSFEEHTRAGLADALQQPDAEKARLVGQIQQFTHKGGSQK